MTRRWLCTVAAVAAVVGLVAACSGPGRHRAATQTSTPAAPGSPSPTSSELPKGVLASIPLTCCGTLINGSPQDPVAAFGSLWVGSHRGTHAFRIDPRTDKVIATIDVNDESCTQPVPTPRYLIVERCNTTSAALIDPRTNQVIGSVPGHIDAYAFGSAWGVTANFDALERVDLATHHIMFKRRMDVGPIAVTNHELWVLDVDSSGYIKTGIVRIDPKTNHVLGTMRIPDPGYNPNIVYAYGAMWVKGADNAVLVRADLSTLNVTSYKLPGYAAPTDFGDDSPVAGEGSVWMRLNADWIARIDPGNGKIVGRYPSDRQDGGAFIQVAFGSLWVASGDGGFLLRDRIGNP